MLVGVAPLPLSFPPSKTWAFYIINRPNCLNICNTVKIHVLYKTLMMFSPFNHNSKSQNYFDSLNSLFFFHCTLIRRQREKLMILWNKVYTGPNNHGVLSRLAPYLKCLKLACKVLHDHFEPVYLLYKWQWKTLLLEIICLYQQI